MPEVDKKIASPFARGDIKIYERLLGKKLEEGYDRSIVLTNSFKSAFTFFAEIKVRTGWLGEFGGLINDIESKKLKKSLMVEKFSALSLSNETFSLENLSLPKLEWILRTLLLCEKYN